MEKFSEQIRYHANHVAEMGAHCVSEETTKQALIVPLLDILGFSPSNPLKVKAEYETDFLGVKKAEKVDYALFVEGESVMFIEAKAFSEPLANHAPQLSRYFNASPGVRVTALTNGREWKFFTDLQLENIMDSEPFFVVDFLNLKESDIQELARFHYDNIRSDNIRTFAEDQAYLSKFKDAIQASLRQLDSEFVKFVVTKALPNVRMTQKNMESMTPLVKRAVAEAMSGMLVNSLNPPHERAQEPSLSSHTQEVDPSNPTIITTAEEKRFFEVVQGILRDRIDLEQVTTKDTEGYYAVLYLGKNNRWIVRYNVNRKRPVVYFRVDLTEQHRHEIARAGLELGSGGSVYLDSPEHIMRVPGLLFDSLDYCQDNENFKRAGTEMVEAL